MSEATRSRRRGIPWRELLGHDAPVLLGLAGLAVAQPLFHLLGTNAEFFVSKETTGAEFVALAAVIAVALPLGAIALEALGFLVSSRLGRGLRATFVFSFAAAFGLVLARQIGLRADPAALALAGACGALVLLAEARLPVARLFLPWLALGPVAFVALFLGGSDAARAVFVDDAEITRGTRVERPSRVVLVIFDEFSLASLLRPDGTINVERFPNFARLAETATWFRNATAVTPGTHKSVPSVITGIVPELNWRATTGFFPRNLFTLLGERYDVHAIEPLTRLCPASLCPAHETSWGHLASALIDAAVIYGHHVLPVGLAADLPRIDQGWGNFLDQDAELLVDSEDVRARQLGPAARQGAIFRRFVRAIQPADRPQLSFVHLLVPHIPWQLAPTGHQYVVGTDIRGWTREVGYWVDDPFVIRQAYQRHVLQVGFVDRLVGELVDHLVREDLWDETLLVVTADHGVSFMALKQRRHPNTPEHVDAIYRVPLFIKRPGQARGGVRDDAALLVDVLPTIMDELAIRPAEDWPLDGRALFADTSPPEERPLRWKQGPQRMTTSLDGLFELVARRDALVPQSGGWSRLAAIGEHADWIGEPLASFEIASSAGRVELTHEAMFDQVDLDSGFLPLLIEGRVVPAQGEEPPEEILVALNGRIAGVGGGLVAGGGGFAFTALVDQGQLRAGRNEISLFAPDARNGTPRLRPLARAGAATYALRGRLAAGEGSIVAPDGRELLLVRPRERYVIGINPPHDHRGVLAIASWAADVEERVLPDALLLFSDGTHRATAKLGWERPDIAELHGEPLRHSGYELLFPASFVGTRLDVVAVFGDRAVVKPVESE